MNPLFVRVTHTGKYQDGRDNPGPIQITDLDTGLENQNRKVPVYVPPGSSIDIPLSSRSMLSLERGALAKFAASGLVDLQLIGNPVGGMSHSVAWGEGQDATLWADVMKVISASKATVTVIPKADPLVPLQIPPGTYDLQSAEWNGYKLGDWAVNIVEIQDGALLKNIGPCRWSWVLRSLSSSPTLENIPQGASGPSIYFLDFGHVWQNSGTAPMITVADNHMAVFVNRGGGVLPGTAEVIQLGDASILIWAIREGIQSLDPNFVSGPASAIMLVQHDGTVPFPLPAFPLFNGSIFNVPVGLLGGTGPTSFRPASFLGPISIGCMYFDTDLVPPKPIWWDGAQWVDATGVAVLAMSVIPEVTYLSETGDPVSHPTEAFYTVVGKYRTKKGHPPEVWTGVTWVPVVLLVGPPPVVSLL